MNEKIYIGVAWPYANGSLHLGHIAGCYLPADIFARYHRMSGNDVLMVSGSDEHGTPITITADKEHTTPQAIVDRYNKEQTENMIQFGISFDLFTRTTTKNHTQVVQDLFKTLYEKNHIYKKEVEAFYCFQCKRFLPDRYIEGDCPYCRNKQARGDQCDECGHLMEVEHLHNVRCKLCGSTPELQVTEHLYFALSQFQQKLLDWISDKTYWKSSVFKFTDNWLKEGLLDRAITRDMSWGIPVPLDGFENKRIYVWFDAVTGYLSASKEWAQRKGNPEQWREWWLNAEAKHYYFLAKDNIPFHSIIWPSMLMGYNAQLQLPFNIPANEYLRLRGEQFSKSKGLGVWVPDVVKKFNVDAVRYYLSINMPENRDANWEWEDFIIKNNDELVGTYGNFIHRVVTFTKKNFGCIPKVGPYDTIDQQIQTEIATALEEVQKALANCQFKQGIKIAMNLAKKGNIYFNDKEPWAQVKTDKNLCATTLHVCLQIVQALAVCMAPYLPFSSQTIWEMIGNKGSIHETTWNAALEPLHEGYELTEPKLLFKKLVFEEIMTESDPFSKVDLRAAKVLEVQNHPDADKLYLLKVDLGELGERTIVAGMRAYYTIEEMTGKTIVMVANLKAAKIRGIKSRGMLLAATDIRGIVSLLNPGEVPAGTKIYTKGIPQETVGTLDFDDFMKIKLTVDENQNILYHNHQLQTDQGLITTDKEVAKGAKIK